MHIKMIILAAAVLAAGESGTQNRNAPRSGTPSPMPTSSPTTTTAPARRQWGRSKAGLAVSAASADEWSLTRTMKLNLAVRNTGIVPGSLGGKEQLFAYLLIAQKSNVYYTEKIKPAGGIAKWTGKLDPAKTLQMPTFDIAGLKVFSYMRGLKVKDGYPVQIVGGEVRSRLAAGKVADVLRPGPVKVKCVMYLDREAEGTLLLEGKMIKVSLGVGDFSRLPEQRRKRLLADLSARMKKDAFSAKAACMDAVRMGVPAISTLAKVVHDARAKDFARMWAATALAGIGGKDAADVLIECLTDKTAGVRYVAAYHGLRAKNARFDKALNERAIGGKDPMLTAWAIMGYLKFRKSVPPALLIAGVNSPQPKARAAVVETIAGGKPDRSHLPILRKLLGDDNAMIRRRAARAIGYIGDKSPETIGALIEALGLKGDNAAEAVAATLCTLMKKKWAYRAAATPKEKSEIIQKWRQWWEQNK